MNLTFRMRVHSTPRSETPALRSLESELLWRLSRAVEGGAPLGGAGVVVRARTVDIVDLGDALRQGIHVQAALGSLARTSTEVGGEVEALGWLGRVEAPRADGRGKTPCAAVFLEWEDCRWWLWTARLGAGGVGWQVGTAQERSALEGDALPPGLGRYWTWARRTGQRPRHLAAPGAAPVEPLPGVH
jgi:hypothetical protein